MAYLGGAVELRSPLSVTGSLADQSFEEGGARWAQASPEMECQGGKEESVARTEVMVFAAFTFFLGLQGIPYGEWVA